MIGNPEPSVRVILSEMFQLMKMAMRALSSSGFASCQGYQDLQ